jgi:sterol desaturase/sphingolipid hydroxylase (fatty acid hydroxylase superfamily)
MGLWVYNLLLAIILEFFVWRTIWRLPSLETDLFLCAWAALSFLGADLMAYWFHRVLHGNKHLYRTIHSIHHKEVYPNLMSTITMHPLEMLSFFTIYRLPVVLIPFNRITFGIYQTVLIIWVLLDHSWDRWIFSGHFSHHRLLHGNYATCLPVWDHLFGTVIITG